MRSKVPLILIITILGILNFFFPKTTYTEVIEKIYAVVNGELITYSELKNTEIELTRVLQQQFKGDELKNQIENMKKNLLERIIEQKIIYSHALAKNYDIDSDIEMIIKEIKKQNNIQSDDELKQALASQGMDYDEWKKQLKESQLQNNYVRDEIGPKIKIDNSAIMDYYKKNMKEFTSPSSFTLNCIFLGKTNYIGQKAIDDKKAAIDAEMAEQPFEKIAEKYSELTGGENNYFLGEYKEGELSHQLEDAALKQKQDEHSGWLETDNGWYIIFLVKRTEPIVKEYKDVRELIDNKLRQIAQDEKLKELLETLKKESQIKIYENY